MLHSESNEIVLTICIDLFTPYFCGCAKSEKHGMHAGKLWHGVSNSRLDMERLLVEVKISCGVEDTWAYGHVLGFRLALDYE